MEINIKFLFSDNFRFLFSTDEYNWYLDYDTNNKPRILFCEILNPLEYEMKSNPIVLMNEFCHVQSYLESELILTENDNISFETTTREKMLGLD